MRRTVRSIATPALAAALVGWVSYECSRAPTAGAGVDAASPAGRAAPPPAKAASREVPSGAFRFDPALFSIKRPPRPGDWLASHREEPQTFDAHVNARAGLSLATPARRVIVLQPLGHFSEADAELLESLAA